MKFIKKSRNIIYWFNAFKSFFRKYGIKRSLLLLQSHYEYGGYNRVLAIARRYIHVHVLSKATENTPNTDSTDAESLHGKGTAGDDSAYRLDDDYSLNLASWEQYTNEIAQNKIQTSPEENKTTPFAVIVDCSNLVDVSEDKLVRSRASIDLMISKVDHPVDVYWIGGEKSDKNNGELAIDSDNELLANLNEDSYYLLIKAGDEVLEFTYYAIQEKIETGAECFLVDMFYVDNAKAYPLFWGKFDKILAEAGSYYFDRLIVKGGLMVSASNSVGKLDYDLLRSYLVENPVAISNITKPLIKLDITRESFQAFREELSGNAREPVELLQSTSVVILSKNNGLLLQQLVNNLLSNNTIKEVIVVSNNPTNAYAIKIADKLKQNPKCKVVDFNEDFNFSKQCNLGAQQATGEYLLFLNDDICPVTDDWLSYMLAWMDKPRMVGAMLIYPDQRIQHLGMYLGFNGVAGHSLRFGTIPDSDPNYMISSPRQVSCITGAIMLMPKEVFENMNGFDPQFATYLQDVDLCLRATELGVDMVIDPRAILIHMESVTIKPTLNSSDFQSKRFREYSFYQRKWKGKNYLNDEYLSPNIDISDESFKTLNRNRLN